MRESARILAHHGIEAGVVSSNLGVFLPCLLDDPQSVFRIGGDPHQSPILGEDHALCHTRIEEGEQAVPEAVPMDEHAGSVVDPELGPGDVYSSFSSLRQAPAITRLATMGSAGGMERAHPRTPWRPGHFCWARVRSARAYLGADGLALIERARVAVRLARRLRRLRGGRDRPSPRREKRYSPQHS